jgi:hypothetical protein
MEYSFLNEQPEANVEKMAQAQKAKQVSDERRVICDQFKGQFPDLDANALQAQGDGIRSDNYCIHYLYKPTNRVYSYNYHRGKWLEESKDIKDYAMFFDGLSAEERMANILKQTKERAKKLQEKKASQSTMKR